jgi:hypothetical protein
MPIFMLFILGGIVAAAFSQSKKQPGTPNVKPPPPITPGTPQPPLGGHDSLTSNVPVVLIQEGQSPFEAESPVTFSNRTGISIPRIADLNPFLSWGVIHGVPKAFRTMDGHLYEPTSRLDAASGSIVYERDEPDDQGNTFFSFSDSGPQPTHETIGQIFLTADDVGKDIVRFVKPWSKGQPIVVRSRVFGV